MVEVACGLEILHAGSVNVMLSNVDRGYCLRSDARAKMHSETETLAGPQGAGHIIANPCQDLEKTDDKTSRHVEWWTFG